MQDVKLPKNNLEAFEMWRDSWRADLIGMLSSSKRIPVRYYINVVDQSTDTILDAATIYLGGGVYKEKVGRTKIQLTPREA